MVRKTNFFIFLLTALLALLLTGCVATHNGMRSTYTAVKCEDDSIVNKGVFVEERAITNDKDFSEILEGVEVDYILITDGTQSMEPRKLRSGDSFLNLTLSYIWDVVIDTIDGEFLSYWIVSAMFSGELVVFGDLRITKDYISGSDLNLFTVHEKYLEQLPFLANDDRAGGIIINIRNENELFRALGLEEHEIYWGMDVEFRNLTIRIHDYLIFYHPTFQFGHSSADILEIINDISCTAEHNLEINWGIVVPVGLEEGARPQGFDELLGSSEAIHLDYLFLTKFMVPFELFVTQPTRSLREPHRDDPSRFTQGFWGDVSHAGKNDNRLGAVDIGTQGNPRELSSMLDGRIVSIDLNRTVDSIIQIESTISNQRYILQYMHVNHRSSTVRPADLGKGNPRLL